MLLHLEYLCALLALVKTMTWSNKPLWKHCFCEWCVSAFCKLQQGYLQLKEKKTFTARAKYWKQGPERLWNPSCWRCVCILAYILDAYILAKHISWEKGKELNKNDDFWCCTADFHWLMLLTKSTTLCPKVLGLNLFVFSQIHWKSLLVFYVPHSFKLQDKNTCFQKLQSSSVIQMWYW